MSKHPKKLRYGDQLADGRYVIMAKDQGETVKIVFVGGTSVSVPSDKEVEIRKAAK